MAKTMLIDAAHLEETRVVVVSGNRVEEFDFESENRKQLRGNIYLAKVTRVEPSLQAAFVEYGGNRHGFLAFSEIHPDYYQIPVADREALLRQQAAEARRERDEEDADDGIVAKPDRNDDVAEAGAGASDEDGAENDADDNHAEDNGADDTGSIKNGTDEAVESGNDDAVERGETETVLSDETIESVGAEDAMEEAAPRKQRVNYRSYKIQEVVKRRQIMLVQVVKEERGNKGAALTTFLSLAGRYCVLMPNTARGGGISRKITIAADRKKLKGIAESLDVPEGMGLIVRTAGAKRTKAEIKRDYEYLLRMWESVRELTLQSIAPALVYEEGSLIKRSIRDLYDKDIDAIHIEGDEGYREAKGFMRMLMPSHAKNVQPYKDKQPLFQKYGVEQQLDSMLNPTVTLKSGGYIVINPTEALVSIDVNSGRSTKERNIEQTALKTNLEAAEEITRQMRLRDLAGLIVIDFIDMDENRNNRAVERKLKDCLKTDRARIQVGRISHFGLLEMSRQRMRSGVLEGSTVTCPHCAGTGLVRSVESMALHVLRGVEAEAVKGRAAAFTVKVPAIVAIYILNQKRGKVLDIEDRYGVSLYIEADATLTGSDHRIEQAEARALTRTRPAQGAINIESGYAADDEDVVDAVEEDEDEDEAEQTSEAVSTRAASDEGDGEGQRKRKRRRRRRKPGEERGAGAESETAQASDDAGEEGDAETSADGEAREGDQSAGGADELDENGQRKRRRRGRRGGRRNRRRQDDDGETMQAVAGAETPDDASARTADDIEVEGDADAEAPVLLSYSRTEAAVSDDNEAEEFEAAFKSEAASEPEAAEANEPAQAAEGDGDTLVAEKTVADTNSTQAAEEPERPSEPVRRGWWQRR